VDHVSRSRIRKEKGARDRLIRLALSRPEWALGFEDETWWSRFERPSLHSWAEWGQPMRLIDKEAIKGDTDPKALAAYGMLVRTKEVDGQVRERTWLRFVDGRPVSSITTQFLEYSCQKLAAMGKKALLMIWDNASWHTSKEVRSWIAEHNRGVKKSGSEAGVQIVPCLLPKKSPWLNAIEPKWIHGKRKVVEPEGLLGAYELADRVCRVFGCPHYEHLSILREVA
jgi:DDE superfamily endonuclease